MKFGCCVNMLPGSATKIGYEFIPLVNRMGFDYLELPVAQVMELSDEAFDEGPLAAVWESNIPCLRMNNFFPGSYRLTGPAADHQAALSYAQRAFSRAKRLGAEVIVLGSSGARNRPCGTSAETALSQMESFLRALAPLAKEHGLQIAIEHLNKLESNIINSFWEGCELARRVGSPDVGALLDTYHMNMVNEKYETLRGSGDLLKHVHLARTLSRGFPREGDEEDYPGLFAALRGIGYEGTVSFEANAGGDFEEEASHALRLMRRLAEKS